MKPALLSLFVLGGLLPMAAQSAQIVDVSAISPTGTTITLNAGTYQVSVIGTTQGGAYDGWNYGTDNIYTPSAAPAYNAWVDSFTMTIDSISTSYFAPGNPGATSALAALANYQSNFLNPSSGLAASVVNTAVFTLTQSQTVNFTVADSIFWDNWGGISLEVSQVPLSAVPEPSTFALLGLTLVGLGVVRRKFVR